MSAFLKSIGDASDPIVANWMKETPAFTEKVWFPKVPRSVKRGDFLVYYGAGRRRVCAVVEVTDDQPTATEGGRWPWFLGVRVHMAIPADEHAPTLEDVKFSSLRVRRQSHVRLTPVEFKTMADQIASRGTRSVAIVGA